MRTLEELYEITGRLERECKAAAIHHRPDIECPRTCILCQDGSTAQDDYMVNQYLEAAEAFSKVRVRIGGIVFS